MTHRHWYYVHLILLLAFTCWLTGCAFASEWVVVNSKVSIDYTPHEQRYEVRETTITADDSVIGDYRTKAIAEDVAYALNEAHRHRELREYAPDFIPNPARTRQICAETFGCKFDGEVCSCEKETKTK